VLTKKAFRSEDRTRGPTVEAGIRGANSSRKVIAGKGKGK